LDKLSKLPREVKVVLGGGLLYLIFSFLDWQQAFGYGVSEWHGWGVIAGITAIALLVWEALRLMDVKLELPVEPGLVSVTLALLLLLFTLITFITHDVARHWPAWVGLILSIVIAVAALMRARDENVHLPAAKPTA